MSVDFQVVFPQNLVPLSSVSYMAGIQPRTLDVIGEDFTAIDEVRVNDKPSPSIVIVSPQRMIVQVPDNVLDRVTSVTVISNRLTIADKNLLRFRLGRTTTKVSGILRLCQLFVKVLFTTKGSDIWMPRMGGSGLKNLGRSFSSQAGQSVVSDFVISVDTTVKQIIATQSKDATIPPDEKLMRATLKSVNFNRNEGALIPTIELLNQTGQPALTSLFL